MAKFLVFTRNTAIILNNPDIASELLYYPNVIPEPDLSKVAGVPIHFWKMQDGKVIPMTEDEKKFRVNDIETNGLDRNVEILEEIKLAPEPPPIIPVEKIVEVHNIYESKHLKIALYAMIAVIILTQFIFIFKK